MKSRKVFAPATGANVGGGFEAMGFAFEGAGDVIRMELISESQIIYENRSGISLPEDPQKNIMTPTLRAMFEATGYRGGVKVEIIEKILPGSGVGSSAAAVASAAYAFNRLINGGFNDDQLIEFALEGESMASGSRHADNVAPAVVGGFVLVRDYNPIDVVKIQRGAEMFCAIIHPHIEVKTIESRAVLPKELPLATAIRQWANLGAMIGGITTGDLSLVGRALNDYVAEPHRKRFIPEYDQLKSSIIKAGAFGANISGSGPSVFALCSSMECADRVVEVMKSHFERLGIEANGYASPISDRGTREIE